MAKRSYPLPKVKNDLKLNDGPKLKDTEKGKEITEVWTDNDLGAIRGTPRASRDGNIVHSFEKSSLRRITARTRPETA